MLPPLRDLSDAERLDWLRLSRSENVGPITFFQLLERFGSADAALKALPQLARRGGGRSLNIPGRAEAETEIAATTKAGARIVAAIEPAYPARLRFIDDAPPLLTMKGHAALAPKPAIAIVGARNASAIGQRFTRDLAQQIAARGLVVASGLARGIDRAAHEGALAAQAGGGTMAFIGAGVDVVFPPENADLHQRIAEAGTIYSEYPVGTPAKPQNFPRRNRLISGASLAVLVVEAALKSGSLITARMAAQQGREVMAVPGSPLDPRCHGTNDLIRQGATLVERLDDILSVVEPLLRQDFGAPLQGFGTAPPSLPSDTEIAAAHRALQELLSPSAVAVDELIRLSGLAPGLVQMVLLDLELAGKLHRHPGNKVALA